MDIYGYLNSKDVAEHCRKLNYEFNALESAFIINNCRWVSINEKHSAFRKLMESMPDMQLPQNLSHCRYNLGLFNNLNKKIRYEEEFLDAIYNNKYKMVYTYTTYNIITKLTKETRELFSSYELAKEAASENSKDDMIIISAAEVDSSAQLICYLNRANEIESISYNDGEFYEIACFLDEIGIDMPTPFVKGDLLTANYNNTPIVLKSIDYWKRGKEGIIKETAGSCGMTAWGYFVDSEGNVYDCFFEAYHDLEYYHGELIIKDELGSVIADYRLLKALSAYMKGNINEGMLLSANNLIRAEHNMQRAFPEPDYDDKWHKEAGIDDIFEKSKLIRRL